MKVSLIAALTIDGFIARHSQEFASWTSKEDKKRFVTKTKEAKCIILGSKTFYTFPKPLPERTHVIYSRNITECTEILKKKFGWDTIPENILITDKSPRELVTDLEHIGFREAMVCGGSEIYTLFLEAGIITNLYLTIEPVVFGTGISLFKKEVIQLPLELQNVEKTEFGTIFLDYQIKN
jgi:dihydrofolate reductase